jgi:hypothetical protein
LYTILALGSLRGRAWEHGAAMGVAETVAGLAEFAERGAGTNAERRAALWLSGELHSDRREAGLETFWCRPNWAMAQAWHALLLVAGSLVSVASPRVGGGLIVVGLLSLILDNVTGRSLGRRLTRERASQNVVSPARPGSPPVRLIITANYDAGRMGLVYRPLFRRPGARLKALLGPLAPGWLAGLGVAALWVLVTAVLRDRGSTGTALAVAQVIPTAGLVIAFALLLDLAGSSPGPAAADNGAGTAVALALARALDVAPPRKLAVEVVLQGASDRATVGLRRHLRGRRPGLSAANTIVIGLAACGAGSPRYWVSDGPLIPLAFARRLVQLTQAAAGTLEVGPHRGRGVSPAYAARFAGLPAITLGGLDGSGLVPRSHLPTDRPAAVDIGACDRLLGLALTLIDAIDAELPEAAAPAAQSIPDAASS